MLFDSNVLIQYINGELNIVKQLNAWRQEGRAFIISSITTAEVLSLKTLNAEALIKVKIFLQSFLSVPFDDAIAEAAAQCRRAYGLSLPDAAIAATAITLKLPVVTQDRQFKKIRELTVVEL